LWNVGGFERQPYDLLALVIHFIDRCTNYASVSWPCEKHNITHGGTGFLSTRRIDHLLYKYRIEERRSIGRTLIFSWIFLQIWDLCSWKGLCFCRLLINWNSKGIYK
jgi:hypothetical protein